MEEKKIEQNVSTEVASVKVGIFRLIFASICSFIVGIIAFSGYFIYFLDVQGWRLIIILVIIGFVVGFTFKKITVKSNNKTLVLSSAIMFICIILGTTIGMYLITPLESLIREPTMIEWTRAAVHFIIKETSNYFLFGCFMAICIAGGFNSADENMYDEFKDELGNKKED